MTWYGKEHQTNSAAVCLALVQLKYQLFCYMRVCECYKKYGDN